MSSRLTGWLAAGLAVLVTLVLIIGELTNAGQRRWWGSHSLTTSTVSGLLVLLITVLVVNQLIKLRQGRQRSHAVAAQAAIVAAQAAQSASVISAAARGSGDRDAAAEGFRTYMVMLLISAPVFIDDSVARRFLEQAQNLGGVMARSLTLTGKTTSGAATSADGLDKATKQLQSAAAPLLQLLDPAVRDSIQRIGRTPEK